MDLKRRKNAFVKLGNLLKTKKFSDDTYNRVEIANPWFIRKNVEFAINSISNLLDERKLNDWLSKYPKIQTNNNAKNIAVVMAGNIPLVGFHDFLSVLISGNNIIIKLSGKDNILLKEITKLLIEIEPKFNDRINFTDTVLKGFDAIITTGSDNSAKYFSHYFKKYPHIIRKNRISVAIINGEETEAELKLLANDIFMYFGLGCRNVSKIYIPENYKLDKLFESFVDYASLLNHNKYTNNYDYNRSIYMMNNIKFLENSFVIMKEDTGFFSPISVIFYEYYNDISQTIDNLSALHENIQIIVGNMSEKFIKFGNAQKPDLNDYADNIDTIKFLSDL